MRQTTKYTKNNLKISYGKWIFHILNSASTTGLMAGMLANMLNRDIDLVS